MKRSILFLLLLFVTSSCRISYSFRTASIDYELTKTLYIGHFVNQAPLVYPPLEQRFNEEMKDYFTRNTRLQLVNQNGDKIYQYLNFDKIPQYADIAKGVSA